MAQTLTSLTLSRTDAGHAHNGGGGGLRDKYDKHTPLNILTEKGTESDQVQTATWVGEVKACNAQPCVGFSTCCPHGWVTSASSESTKRTQEELFLASITLSIQLQVPVVARKPMKEKRV